MASARRFRGRCRCHGIRSLSSASQNGRGNTGYSFRNPGDNGIFFDRLTTDREARGLQDFVWIPRWENSVDLSPTQVVLAGVSGAFGSNETGANSRTQIYGADLFYKWKSARAEGGFPFVKWQTRIDVSPFRSRPRCRPNVPGRGDLSRLGHVFAGALGFQKGLGRWDSRRLSAHAGFAISPTTRLGKAARAFRRISPGIRRSFRNCGCNTITIFCEENFFLAGRDVDSVFLQFEFILGAHGAHKF